MTYLTKSLMGAIAAAGFMAATPVAAGTPTLTPAQNYMGVIESQPAASEFHKKRKHDRRYSSRRDQRLAANSRVWRGKDGRYYCKRDNGTTGLLIGAAVGGLAGHEIAGSGDKLLGAVLGAAGGGLLGREIDRDKYRCR